jgi:hypothetical protein
MTDFSELAVAMLNPRNSTRGLYGGLLLLRYIHPKLFPRLAPDSAVRLAFVFPG